MTDAQRITIEGAVLALSRKAVKIKTLLSDEWIPRSQILDSDTEISDLKEGDEVAFEIPLWLAREKGWAE